STLPDPAVSPAPPSPCDAPGTTPSTQILWRRCSPHYANPALPLGCGPSPTLSRDWPLPRKNQSKPAPSPPKTRLHPAVTDILWAPRRQTAAPGHRLAQGLGSLPAPPGSARLAGSAFGLGPDAPVAPSRQAASPAAASFAAISGARSRAFPACAPPRLGFRPHKRPFYKTPTVAEYRFHSHGVPNKSIYLYVRKGPLNARPNLALGWDLPAGNSRAIGAGGGNRTHGLGIMRPSLYH